MNVAVYLLSIFIKTLPTNFDETLRVGQSCAKECYETFWCNCNITFWASEILNVKIWILHTINSFQQLIRKRYMNFRISLAPISMIKVLYKHLNTYLSRYISICFYRQNGVKELKYYPGLQYRVFQSILDNFNLPLSIQNNFFG